MLISYNWLKQYVPLTEPVEKIIERLIAAGVAVEGLRHLGRDINKVIVAELLSVEKHPQADRLSITKVNTGKETLQVVCGAKNIAPGQKVPLAQVGAILPGGLEIKAAKIRGVESFGMLCSAKELGLATDAEGIHLLSDDAPLGTDLISYLGLPDTLFELEITPNRSDLLSHLGVAREAGAIFHKKVKIPSSKIKESAAPISKMAEVSLEAKDLCLLYTCRVLEGVKIGPSPKWLSQVLERLGHHSINNVVDITNYVLHEMGQPLHAFDLDQVHGSKIIVRQAKDGERIPLLDGTEKPLKKEMLVIADKDRPIALAGIMGGSNSQVDGGTTRILLESALFLPGSVRKTARSLGLSTDSSYRFERGVDPAGVEEALNRAASLILEIAGGKAAKGILSQSSKGQKPAKVTFRPSRANAILGTDLSTKAQLEFLKNLGCQVKGAPSAKSFSVEAPSWRLDLTREIDLIEEIARLNGYDKIPSVAPAIPSVLSELGNGAPYEKEIRFVFHQAGLYEAVSSTFLPATFSQKLKLAEGHPLRGFQEVTNPIADDQRVLRPTLLPSLLAAVQLNLSHRLETVLLYEMNKVFLPDAKGQTGEKIQAAAVLAGLPSPGAWHNPERKMDFFDLKGLAESLARQCRLGGLKWEFGTCQAPYDPAQSLRLLGSKGETLLWGGALGPKVLKEYDIAVPCYALEVEMGALSGAALSRVSFKALPKFPQALRDIALVVPDGVTSAQVMEAIREQGGADLREINLFDLYRGASLPAGFRSLAYRLQFRNEERTLNDQEVTESVSRIIESLKKRYAVALR